ncbi:hypothetical protein HUG10_03355 [Halorarum halophilum]|uniref:Uncharacterized protein n=1 Tax=Halorarum halophilum TaxID=2743090 RepID=A0A7D5K6E7_9EURY|nr:hypothetical protein [Halobaculum halophilum]QLG26634.1 hypothetical protein HUG10_03355 [Halobaculum halophilum]
MNNDIDAPGGPGAFLVTYRMAIYLGGVAVIGLPLVLHNTAGVTVSQSARLAITIATLGLMTATYIAERRLGRDSDVTGDEDGTVGSDANTGEYPMRTRIAVASAVLGLAAGVYVGLEVSWLAGLMFVAGAYFFAYLAYAGDGGGR